MKTKLLYVGILSLVGWVLGAPNAQAGLFHHHRHCCDHCRPYNAFSPPCCCCDWLLNCLCQFQGCAPGCGPIANGVGISGSPAGINGAPVVLPANPVNAPLPPINNTSFIDQYGAQPYMALPYNVQPAGYYPNYYPQPTYPTNYNPYPMYPAATPYYWYGGR